jgi:hypothetical protein
MNGTGNPWRYCAFNTNLLRLTLIKTCKSSEQFTFYVSAVHCRIPVDHHAIQEDWLWGLCFTRDPYEFGHDMRQPKNAPS